MCVHLCVYMCICADTALASDLVSIVMPENQYTHTIQASGKLNQTSLQSKAWNKVIGEIPLGTKVRLLGPAKK